MSDLISREYMKSLGATCIASRSKDGNMFPIVSIDELPSVQPELSNNLPKLDSENGELISRQAAIDAISKKQDGVFDQDAEIDTAILYVYSECKAIIKDLPSVQPRKGKWIDTNPDEYLDPRMTCDQCGNTEILHKANFCPNCGCRMEEGDSE